MLLCASGRRDRRFGRVGDGHGSGRTAAPLGDKVKLVRVVSLGALVVVVVGLGASMTKPRPCGEINLDADVRVCLEAEQ